MNTDDNRKLTALENKAAERARELAESDLIKRALEPGPHAKPPVDYDELIKLRAMHAALVELAKDHPPTCCAYCRYIRQRIDAVLAKGPAAVVYGLPQKCERWK